MVFLALQDPYYAELFKEQKGQANMQMNDLVDYEINSTTVSARLEADEWNRYTNKDEFLNFKANVLRGNLEHNVTSKKAIYSNSVAKFQEDANYINSDGIKLVSDEIIYDEKKQAIRSDVNFTITQNSDIIVGKSAVYDLNSKQTRATGVRANIQQDRQR